MGLAGLGYQKLHPLPPSGTRAALRVASHSPLSKKPSPLSTLVQVAKALVQGMLLNFVCPDEQLCLFKLHFEEVLIEF
jgi:hypothetical protein